MIPLIYKNTLNSANLAGDELHVVSRGNMRIPPRDLLSVAIEVDVVAVSLHRGHVDMSFAPSFVWHRSRREVATRTRGHGQHLVRQRWTIRD